MAHARTRTTNGAGRNNTGCPHLAMRAVTAEEEPRLEQRRLQPFTCDDCSTEALGPSRFTQAYVMNLMLQERADRIRQEEETPA